MLGLQTCIFSCQVKVSAAAGTYIHQQRCDDDIHGLAIADLLVCPTVRGQDSPQPANALFILEAWILRQTPVQILLNLFYC
jgi:hypothetical protein